VRARAAGPSDNKNFALFDFLACLILHRYCKEIQLSFLLRGHTHEDIDQFFSVLTRHMVRLGVVKTPQAFQAEMRKAATGKGRRVDVSMVDAVPDWTAAMKPFANATIVGIQRAHFAADTSEDAGGSEVREVRTPHVFRFTKRQRDGMVVMHYKEFSGDEIWLPPQNPRAPVCEWVTDPNGIELFLSHNLPPDPAQMPIQLAEYVE
jgi:hypothetical protein